MVDVLIFVVDMSSSAHIDKNKKDILVPGKGPTQGLKHTLTAEKMYSINFTLVRKIFGLSLFYKEQIVTYLLMIQKFTNSKLNFQWAQYVLETFQKIGQ